MFAKQIADVKANVTLEALKAENEKLKATLDYVAMMANVEIEEEKKDNV